MVLSSLEMVRRVFTRGSLRRNPSREDAPATDTEGAAAGAGGAGTGDDIFAICSRRDCSI